MQFYLLLQVLAQHCDIVWMLSALCILHIRSDLSTFNVVQYVIKVVQCVMCFIILMI